MLGCSWTHRSLSRAVAIVMNPLLGTLFVLHQQQNLWLLFGEFKPPAVALAAVRSKAVILLLLVIHIVRFFKCSMFCCSLLCVHSGIAIILMGKIEPVTLLFVFFVSRDCCVALPYDAKGLSVYCDCGLS